MPSDYTFPETLLDQDFKDSFLEDLQSVLTQLNAALDHDEPDATADKASMEATLNAMHMLRGAAGALSFSLAFDYAELFHRVAEVGQSFAENLRPEFLKIFNFLKESEKLLIVIKEEVLVGTLDKAPAMFETLSIEIHKDYGDYFYDNKEESSQIETPPTQEDEEENLESFLASMGDAEEPISEEVDKPLDLGGDEPADWDVLQYFYQEVDENLASFEQAILAIEKGNMEAKGEVLRLTHSTKGAANSMGMFRIAKLMHEVEALFERVESEQLHLAPNDFSILLKTADLIRLILEEIQGKTPIEGINEGLDEHIQNLALLGQINETPDTKETGIEPAGIHASKQAVTVEDDYLMGSATANTFRIDADKVDTLLNTVGELIISRTRMSKKMEELIQLCQELNKSRARMQETLGNFSERFEYTRSNRLNHQPAAKTADVHEQYDLTDEFAPLEFDQYDDFNILSRQINEIGNDTDLAIKEIMRGGQEVQLESSSLSNYIGQIQDEIASTRLAPIVVLYKRLERAVRDAALKMGREVKLVTAGDDLLIDKSILDDLFQPMLHIVRNCVVHAFSDSNDNENMITLQARQQGGRILLSVGDNGDGINFEKVRKLATEKQLLEADADDQALVDVIFAPGFSTTDVADEVSGRGIGLDAVKASIEGFGGSVEVQSTKGKGTTFLMHLPLTLAIDRGMYFYVGDQLYAVFMSAVEQVYFSRDLQFEHMGNKEMVLIEGTSIPVIDLRIQFEKPIDASNQRESIILCRYLNMRIALKVDRVFYQDDIVVKSLGKLFENHRFFTSATIHGDGEIVPILDISRFEHLIEKAASVMDQIDPFDSDFVAPQIKILVVDDSLSVRKVCEDYLSSSDYIVETANDGLEALNKVKSNQYSLIFSDLEMPRLNGLELLAELKRSPDTAPIPVVVITSRTTAKHREKAMNLGAKQCIGKPFTKESLLAVAEEHLLQTV
ncbi:MAG: hybrid sensor histidine kinase/response regulator [Opitutaceae bacterium]